MTNQLFFTITLKENETHFTSDQYTFTIKDSEQQIGTNGKALWYYRFEPTVGLDLNWLSWNQKSNDLKSWEYLLLDLKGILYSGFINKSKSKEDTCYCQLQPLPPKPNFEIIY